MNADAQGHMADVLLAFEKLAAVNGTDAKPADAGCEQAAEDLTAADYVEYLRKRG